MKNKEIKKILVTGAGGFIGGHLIKRLLRDNPSAIIVSTDIKPISDWYQASPETTYNDNIDLRDISQTKKIFDTYGKFDEVWALACDHGGIGYLKSREYECALDASINLNLLQCHIESGSDLFFYTSSACVYNESLQTDTDDIIYLKEDDVHPANPDSVYGWVKLLTEKAVLAAIAERGVNARIARIHGCYGPYNSFDNIKEKAPNALLRKAMSSEDGYIDVWSSTDTIRSFMYVDDCVEGLVRLSRSDFNEPINIGSDMTVSIGEVAGIAANVVGNKLDIRVVNGERGVACRSCDCTLMENILKFKPTITVEQGLQMTCGWMKSLTQ